MEGLDIAVEAFAGFFEELTPKHQREVELHIIEQTDNLLYVNQKVKSLGLEYRVHITDAAIYEDIEKTMEAASIFLYGEPRMSKKLIPQILSYGVPVLCIDDKNISINLDQRCGALIEETAKPMKVYRMTQYLDMLFYDDEALKMLKKGAVAKYNQEYTWREKVS